MDAFGDVQGNCSNGKRVGLRVRDLCLLSGLVTPGK